MSTPPCAPRARIARFDTRTALTETLLLAEREYLDRASAERLLSLSFYPSARGGTQRRRHRPGDRDASGPARLDESDSAIVHVAVDG